MSGVKGPSDKELKAVEKEKKKEVDEEIQGVSEMDYGGGKNPYTGHGQRRDDDEDGKKEYTAKPISAKDARRTWVKQLNKAFDKKEKKKEVDEEVKEVSEGEKYSGTFYDPKHDKPERSDQAAADFKRIMSKHNVKSRDDAEKNAEFKYEILNKHAKKYGGTYQVDNHFGWSNKLAGKSGPHWHKEESEMSFAERLIEGIKRMKENKGSGPKETFTDNNMGEDYQLEEQLDQEINEVLSKNSKAGTWIHDFVHSDNPKFAGKSQAKRKEMALAAYYAKQRNEEVVNEESKDIKVHSDAGKHIGTITHGKYQSVAYAHPTTKFGGSKEPHPDEDSMMLKGPQDNQKGIDFIKAHHKDMTESVNEEYKDVKVHSDDGKHIGTITHGKYQSVAYAHPTTKFGATKEPAHDEDSMMLKGPHDTQRGIDFIKAHHKDMTEAVDPNVKTTDTLKGTKSGGKPNSFKSFKIKLKEEKKEKEKEEKEPDDADDEDSAADKAKDAKEAKKCGMTMAQWEKSKEDKKQDKEEMDEERDPPFEGGVPAKKGVVTDKSGAKHTPMSRVKDLARQAMKKVKTDAGQ
jgi:hypothetical protein